MKRRSSRVFISCNNSNYHLDGMQAVFYNPDGTYSLAQMSLSMSMQQALTKLYAITKGWLVRWRLINKFRDPFMRGRKGKMLYARWQYRGSPPLREDPRVAEWNRQVAEWGARYERNRSM